MKCYSLIISLLLFSCSDKIQYSITSPNGSKDVRDSLEQILYKDKNWELHKDSIYFLGIYKARDIIDVIKQCPELIRVNLPEHYVLKYSEYKNLPTNKILFLNAKMDTFGFEAISKFKLQGIGISCSYFDTSNSNLVEWDSIYYFSIYSEQPKSMDYSFLPAIGRLNSITLQLDSFDSQLIHQVCKHDSTMPIIILLNVQNYEDFLEAYKNGYSFKGCWLLLATRNLKMSRKQYKSLRRTVIQNEGILEITGRRYFKTKGIVKYVIYY